MSQPPLLSFYGDDLTGNESGGLGQFNSAYGNLATGNFQEWQLGLELSVPIALLDGRHPRENAEVTEALLSWLP